MFFFVVTKLFDDFPRTDPAPAYDTEGSYRFLNRAARPQWERVRELLEAWFSEYPDTAQADLRKRFQDPDFGQHYGAWWELYIYTLFSRLGYQMFTHPEIPGSSKNPDFLARRGDSAMYVECVVHFSGGGGSGSRGKGLNAWIFEATNMVKSPDFFVDIEIEQAGTERPKATDITRPLDNWLSSLDADRVLQDIEAGSETPQLTIDTRGWKIAYGALPIDPEHRGKEGRLIGIYPTSGVYINNETERLRATVRRKGGKYGTPDKPLVIAVLSTSGFVEEDELTEALFGSVALSYYQGLPGSEEWVRQRDGYWRNVPTKRGARVSAVLYGMNVYPWRVTNGLPKVWLNPWASIPVKSLAEFDTTTATDDGEISTTAANLEPSDVFGLPGGWPGF